MRGEREGCGGCDFFGVVNDGGSGERKEKWANRIRGERRGGGRSREG